MVRRQHHQVKELSLQAYHTEGQGGLWEQNRDNRWLSYTCNNVPVRRWQVFILYFTYFNFFYFLGFFKFSPETEKAEKTLFEELKRMKDLLAMDDKKTMLIRAFLCSSFMRNPYALRGRRKVKIVLELLQVGE